MSDREKDCGCLQGGHMDGVRGYRCGVCGRTDLEPNTPPQPGEPVGCQWFCHECNDGRMEDYWPTHCPTCMAKDLKTEDLYLAPQPERDRGCTCEFDPDDPEGTEPFVHTVADSCPIHAPQTEREHGFEPWMVLWVHGISPPDEVYDQLNAAWNESGSFLRFSAWLTERIAAAIRDILGGEE